MNTDEIFEIFEKELAAISNEHFRNHTAYLLSILPEYFWTVPASSSGKYHPQYALGDGGLVRHVKAAVKFALHMFVIEGFSDEEKDAIIAALLLHDGLKHGEIENGTTVHEHPILAANFVRQNSPASYAEAVAPLIETHMGQWTTSKYSEVVLNAPQTYLQKFVHRCDYLASRKDIEVIF